MIRTRLAAALSAALLLGAVSAGFCQEKKIDFKLKLQEGQKYKVRVIDESGSTITSPVREGKFDNFSVISYGLSVDKIEPDKTAKVTVVFSAIRDYTGSRPDCVDYDSSTSKQVKNGKEKVLSLLTGKSYSVRVTPSGRIVGLEGLAELRMEISRGLIGLSGEERKNAEDELDDWLSDEQVTVDMRQLFDRYPAQPVSVGERWENAPVSTKDDPYVIQQYAKITDIKAGVINVKLYSSYMPSPWQETSDGMKMNLTLSGYTSGNATFDEESGMLTSYKLSGSLSGRGSVTKGDMSQDLKVNDNRKNTIQVEIVR